MTYQHSLTVTLLPGATNNSISYLDAEVLTNSQAISYLNNKIYDLWCIDQEISFSLNATYSDYFGFSSTEVQAGIIETPLKSIGTLNPGKIEYKSKLDNINWLLNQNYIGLDPFNLGLNITAGNIQMAIWYLLNQYPATFVPNSRVLALINVANSLGDGFIASANQKQGLVITNVIKINGQIQPRTQPYILITRAVEIKGNTSIPLRFMRELNDKNGLKVKKYLPLQIIKPGEFNLKGLTAGFKYIFKPLRERKLSYFMQNEGERVKVNFK